MKEFDLLEDRVMKLTEALKGKSSGVAFSEAKGLKAENKNLNKKMNLLKSKISKMIKQIDKIERQVV